jgi:hypothetical protein
MFERGNLVMDRCTGCGFVISHFGIIYATVDLASYNTLVQDYIVINPIKVLYKLFK